MAYRDVVRQGRAVIDVKKSKKRLMDSRDKKIHNIIIKDYT